VNFIPKAYAFHTKVVCPKTAGYGKEAAPIDFGGGNIESVA
jgi:hypothetical protein